MSSRPVPEYLLPDTHAVDETGKSQIGGVDLVNLADQFGTPLFVYDEVHLENRCKEAVEAWGKGNVAYATKAFLCKEMARLAINSGMNLDVSTFGELYLALKAGAHGSSIVLHGNNKSSEELGLAIENSVSKIVVDSFNELDRLEALARGRPGPIRVMVRVTPGVEAHTHEYVQTGQDNSKFGFGLSGGYAKTALEKISRSPRLDLVGIHVHIGSQIFSTNSFSLALSTIADFVRDLDIEEVCVGGGLGVGYVEGEFAPTIAQWADTIHQAAVEAEINPRVRLSAEPGRSIVAKAGVTLYRVGTIKDVSETKTFLSVDGGMSDNPRPVLYGSGYEAFLPRSFRAARDKVLDIVGKHCESGDFIIKGANLPGDVVVGDILATPVSGAYGYSMASNYNKVPRPAVVFVKAGEVKEVVRRETHDDLIRLDL